MRTFAVLCLAPGIAAWLLNRLFAARLSIERGTLVLEQPGRRTEIPCDSIARVAAWAVPLPAGGVWLWLQSGRRFRYGLHLAKPSDLIEALSAAGAPETLRGSSATPAARWAQAKYGTALRWYRPLLDFPVFALVPTLPVFRLHQWIAYGGTFGEYYAYGLQAYLLAFAIYWATFTIYLVLYAAALRALTEVVALVAAYAAPALTERARRTAETVRGLAFYGGVPLFLLRLYLSSR
jgi:apolipoprotein N-acyltransferase